MTEQIVDLMLLVLVNPTVCVCVPVPLAEGKFIVSRLWVLSLAHLLNSYRCHRIIPDFMYYSRLPARLSVFLSVALLACLASPCKPLQQLVLFSYYWKKNLKFKVRKRCTSKCSRNPEWSKRAENMVCSITLTNGKFDSCQSLLCCLLCLSMVGFKLIYFCAHHTKITFLQRGRKKLLWVLNSCNDPAFQKRRQRRAQ